MYNITLRQTISYLINNSPPIISNPTLLKLSLIHNITALTHSMAPVVFLISLIFGSFPTNSSSLDSQGCFSFISSFGDLVGCAFSSWLFWSLLELSVSSSSREDRGLELGLRVCFFGVGVAMVEVFWGSRKAGAGLRVRRYYEG